MSKLRKGSSNIDVSCLFGSLVYPCFLVMIVCAAPLETRAVDESIVLQNSTLHFLERTFRSLDLALDFIWREKEQVNLDTIIGTRIVEATMNVLLDKLNYPSNKSAKVPPSILERVIAVRDSARDVSNITIPFIIRNEPDYYAKIGTILKPGIFHLNYQSRDVIPSTPVWPYNPDEAMNEDESDDCLAEIFGTRTGLSCDIASKCWARMTKYGYNEYSLSHEIFYLEIAEGMGCKPEMLFHMLLSSQPGVGSLQELFCANMLSEARYIANTNYPEEMRDLFMEQAALCGILGYRQFFSPKWLEHILSWQDVEDGCYKWDGWTDDYSPDDSTVSRVKREEKRVSRGCLCHRTTVAASALAQYVRYILEDGLKGVMTL